jgi:iron complex transport system permease protein
MTVFRRLKNPAILCGLFLFSLLAFLYSLTVSAFPLYFSEVAEGIVSRLGTFLFRIPATFNSHLSQILFEETMPRSAATVLVGASLAAAGTVYQGIFRNPKVSPDFLGASSGASFGAAVAILLRCGSDGIMFSAFVFGLLAVGSAYVISRSSRANPNLTLLLAGIMVGSLFDSLLAFLEAHADPYTQLPDITFWLMGSFANTTDRELTFSAPLMVAGLLLLFLVRWPVNLLSMGEDEARSMGIGTHFVRGLAIIGATLVTAAGVSICGKVGWVGLVIPHFARKLVGYDNRVLYPAAILMGSGFLTLVDILSHLKGYEYPLGIFTAFVGAPFFLYLILSPKNRM